MRAFAVVASLLATCFFLTGGVLLEPGGSEGTVLEEPAPSPRSWGEGSPLFDEVAGPMGMRHLVTSTWGAAWSDVDGDGRTDLLINRHAQAPPTVFLNRGDHFQPRDDLVSTRKEDRHAPVWGDADNDGDQDLFLTTAAGNPGQDFIAAELFRNTGGGFEEIAAEAGVQHAACRGRGAAWIDHDVDGDLDLLYLCSESDLVRTALFDNRGAAGFVDVADEVGLATNLRWNGGIFPADYDDDGDLDLYLTASTNGTQDLSQLYRNDGGTYTDVTNAAGLGPLLGGRGAAWGDYDLDGDLDLFVARGANFRGNGPDGWTWSPERPREVGIHHQTRREADALDVAILITDAPSLTFDIPTVPIFIFEPPLSEVHLGPSKRNPTSMPFTVQGSEVQGRPQGDPAQEQGVFIWKEGADKWFVATTSGGLFNAQGILVRADRPFQNVRGAFLERSTPDFTNRLFRNDGDGTFTDVTAASGIPADSLNTGPVVAGDFDNDGDLDLFALNGDHPPGGTPDPWVGLRNDGDGTFTDVTDFLGLPLVSLSRKATTVSADYDDDGDLDLWVSNEIGPAPFLYGPYYLFRNKGTGNQGLTIRLVGTTSNRDAVGARVRVEAAGRVQVQDATGGASLYSQNDPRLHFGLGAATQADRVVVRWPDGDVQVFTDVPAGGTVTLTEQP